MTVSDLLKALRNKLSPIYGNGETNAMIRIMFHSLKGWNTTQLIINETQPASEWLVAKCEEILVRLINHEPIQYILGEAYFYGVNLKVSPATLIPRPETEELVDTIVSQFKQTADLRILDIGTGSGAIAIALARNIPFAKVTAIDISEEALQIAKSNAAELKTNVNFLLQDVFKYAPAANSFDIIVSNPPYIDESEKAEMEKNVLDFEPHTALFVPNATPLIYYSRIIEIANSALAPGGSLFFEINPKHADELKAIIAHENFSNVEIIKDIHQRMRFITATKNPSKI